MEPQPGQVGWTDDSLDIVANPGEGGHGDGLPQEGDVDAPGGPQQEHDIRPEGEECHVSWCPGLQTNKISRERSLIKYTSKN